VVGRWELQALRSIGEDGTVTGLPFGEHPHGVLIYTPGGWMAGQLAATSRAMVDDADPLGGPPDQRAAAYSTYVGVTGVTELTWRRMESW
jgi:hypothetical protein